ncbi:hypothetical protein F4806DRAFT_336715 [Annulohypoxylon nitens]|nr:hypothetical protein F4806DRAFT_336715 [Annulohypoxylon nitens]
MLHVSCLYLITYGITISSTSYLKYSKVPIIPETNMRLLNTIASYVSILVMVIFSPALALALASPSVSSGDDSNAGLIGKRPRRIRSSASSPRYWQNNSDTQIFCRNESQTPIFTGK